ncbi:MAG: ABC transporter ATP-binding protein [Clostridiaceae bacterium]|nr:ABC transporter ATP-binding protein [Clostridiaceae bacterium]
MDETVIKIENLYKTFHKNKIGQEVHAVDGVELQIKEGDVYGLIGASGSGKTTILKLMFNLEKPDSGKIFFKGQEMISSSWKERRKMQQRMGLVLQDPYNSLCPSMTVKEILAEPLMMQNKIKNSKEALDKIIDILHRIELDPEKYIDRYPHQLSGGERQRIALGRALMIEPYFLALDEPTSMLDVEVKEEVLRLIKKMAKDLNITILLITHDLSMAASICNYIGVMKEGKLIEEGIVETIINEPREDYTKKLLLASQNLEEYWSLF